MNPLQQLLEYGQSYWLDNLTRGMIHSGELARRVRELNMRLAEHSFLQAKHRLAAWVRAGGPGTGLPGPLARHRIRVRRPELLS